MTSPSKAIFPSESLARFRPDASQDVRRGFASTLVAILNRLNVKPGENFIIMHERDYEDMREAHEDDIKVLREEVEVERTSDEHARKVREMVEDYVRGIVTIDEITEYVTRG